MSFVPSQTPGFFYNLLKMASDVLSGGKVNQSRNNEPLIIDDKEEEEKLKKDRVRHKKNT